MPTPAIITRGVDDVVIGWSDGAQRLTGYAADEMLGHPIHEVLHAEAGAHAVCDACREVALLPKHGDRLKVVWLSTPIVDERGRLIAYTDLLRPLEPGEVPCATQAAAKSGASPLGDGFGIEGRLSFREVIDALPLYGWCCDLDGVCHYLSHQWATYTGICCEELCGCWPDVIHPDDRTRTICAWQVAVAERSDYQVQHRLRGRDGSYRWFEGRGRMLHDARGQRVKWVGFSVDIHDERTAHEMLAREREQLEHIIATAPGAFFSYRLAPDGGSSLPHASAGISEIFGIATHEMPSGIGPTLALVHAEDRERVRESLEVSARALSPWRSEYRVNHPQRGLIWVEGHAMPSLEEAGAIHWYGFLRDITERKQVENSLRATQAQLVTALEAGGMGLFVWHIDQGELWVDDPLLKLLGRPRDTLRGTIDDLYFCVHPEDAEALGVALTALAATGDDHMLEYRVVQPSGQIRFLSAHFRGERDENRNVVRATALHVDVTQERRAAEARLRSQKLEALGTLAGGIAHDFNNMLHAINGNTSLALHALEKEHPARGFLEAVGVAGTRATDLVRRILQFSRPSEVQREVISLRNIVTEALKLVRATVPARIELRVELGDETPHIDADATQIHQIILNLATNGSHAIGSASGFLHVRLTIEQLDAGPKLRSLDLPAGRYAALHVSDSGSGMTPETQARIFDPFFTTKPVGEGTGLGLSVVHGIMKSLGGAVSVRSALGHGATFTLFFPLAERPLSVPSTPPPRPLTGCVGRILFVDDEELLVELGAHMLESLGYLVHGFQKPRDALRYFLSDPYGVDALVTDLAMPELSGFDLAARVLEVRDDLPVVVLTGNVGPDELGVAARLGLHSVLLKPVDTDQLARALRRALRRSQRAHA